ncbi:OLC1v1004602C2 [Oldenlandia corymbosa var. corymbosa]|uniref:OLC1v1004602C2 n=1 Tax=Oldenlandia corymbosa var. corymbosa TaxID=529605 RepID=A0AAV1DDD8_OLDCO|nr:OLC1v1004602C2 [Oldenlandia corymbosa var. corymbosa]
MYETFLFLCLNNKKIPPPFWKSKKRTLPSGGAAVILNGPFGGSWKVQLSHSDQGTFLTEGWKKFYEDHGLVENDFLEFVQSGDSTLNVRIFNDTGVEKIKGPADNHVIIIDDDNDDVVVPKPPVVEVPIVKRKRGRPRKITVADNSLPIAPHSSSNPSELALEGPTKTDQQDVATTSNKQVFLSRKAKILSQYAESLRDDHQNS